MPDDWEQAADTQPAPDGERTRDGLAVGPVAEEVSKKPSWEHTAATMGGGVMARFELKPSARALSEGLSMLVMRANKKENLTSRSLALAGGR